MSNFPLQLPHSAMFGDSIGDQGEIKGAAQALHTDERRVADKLNIVKVKYRDKDKDRDKYKDKDKDKDKGRVAELGRV